MITQSEFKLLYSNIEKTYIYAMILPILIQLESVSNLSILSFALCCEASCTNTEFLQILSEKRYCNRSVSRVAQILQQLLLNTRQSKVQAAPAIVNWVELAGLSCLSIRSALDFVVEELAVEDQS